MAQQNDGEVKEFQAALVREIAYLNDQGPRLNQPRILTSAQIATLKQSVRELYAKIKHLARIANKKKTDENEKFVSSMEEAWHEEMSHLHDSDDDATNHPLSREQFARLQKTHKEFAGYLKKLDPIRREIATKQAQATAAGISSSNAPAKTPSSDDEDDTDSTTINSDEKKEKTTTVSFDKKKEETANIIRHLEQGVDVLQVPAAGLGAEQTRVCSTDPREECFALGEGTSNDTFTQVASNDTPIEVTATERVNTTTSSSDGENSDTSSSDAEDSQPAKGHASKNPQIVNAVIGFKRKPENKKECFAANAKAAQSKRKKL